MGGNNSRLINPNGGDVLPAKIRPLLGQKFEEFRKRRSNNVQGEDVEISKKQLLKDNDGSSDGKSSEKNEISEETQPQKEQQTIIHAVAVEKLSQVVPLPVSEGGNEEEKKEKDEEERKGHKDIIDKDVEKKTNEVSIQENLYEKVNAKHDEEKEENQEEEEEDEDDIGRRIGPGSPSFKIYCVESDEKKEQESHDSQAGSEQVLEKEDQHVAVHNKSHSTDDSDASEVSESENTGEVVKEPSPKKKGHNKRKKLEAMKKNLLNVKNLQKNRMNRMMGCAGNDRRSLLEDN